MAFWKSLPLVALLVLAAGVAFADEKPTALKPTNTWTGSVDDEKLVKEKPATGVITNAKDFEKLWKAWSVADKVPEVNFEKDIVIVDTTVGSKLTLNVSVDDKGDLKAIGLATRDLKPGFRYVIHSVPKEGVKTINGKELPK